MDDEDDIHDRLERLEATVADQQQTIEQLTETPAVGRRSVVASLLGAGAVGGLAGYGSQSARAASGPAGQVGTGEEPVDGFLWDLDVQGQVASDLPMGGNDVTGVGALEADGAEIASSLGIPVYTDDDNAPNGTQYFDDTDGQLEFKDADGVIFTGDGLEDGENFDGQGTSEFTNLSSVSTDDASITNSPTGDDDPLRWQEGVEVGSGSISGTDRSGDDDGWNSLTTKTTSVSFDNAFGSTPTILTSVDSSEDLTGGYMVNVENPSTTGFDMEFVEYHAFDRSDRTLGGTYIATEGR